MVGSERENGSSQTPPPQKAVVKKYGVMNPISYAGPTESDIHRNALLEKVHHGSSHLHYTKICRDFSRVNFVVFVVSF